MPQVNNQSIAIPADYRQAGITGSNLFFNLSDYKANNPACAAAAPTCALFCSFSVCGLGGEGFLKCDPGILLRARVHAAPT